MSTHAYTEEQLVEHPAIGLFAELGLDHGVGVGGSLRRALTWPWATLSCPTGEGPVGEGVLENDACTTPAPKATHFSPRE